MAILPLTEPIYDDDLAEPRFFNGRLLAGDVLTQARDAERHQRQHLGLAVGAGVADGLFVTGAGTTLRVSAGLCLGRAGTTLRLPRDIELSLTDAIARRTGAFAERPPPGMRAVPDIYALILGPATRPNGRAPVSNLGSADLCCNVKDDLQGVQFRLEPILEPDTNPRPPLRDLRNHLAHLCFGTRAGSLTDPVVDAFPQCLPPTVTRSEVPLALFRWATDHIDFIDVWALRRFVTPPRADRAGLVGGSHEALMEAMFLQFQSHLAEQPTLTTSQLEWLPPAGILPDNATHHRFLGAMAPPYPRPVASIQDLRAVLRSGLAHDPIDVHATNPVPLDVYFHGESAVFVRSPRGRVRFRGRLTNLQRSQASLYAVQTSGGMQNTQVNACAYRDSDDLGIYSDNNDMIYAFDLEPGTYYFEVTKIALPEQYESSIAVRAGETILDTFEFSP